MFSSNKQHIHFIVIYHNLVCPTIIRIIMCLACMHLEGFINFSSRWCKMNFANAAIISQLLLPTTIPYHIKILIPISISANIFNCGFEFPTHDIEYWLTWWRGLGTMTARSSRAVVTSSSGHEGRVDVLLSAYQTPLEKNIVTKISRRLNWLMHTLIYLSTNHTDVIVTW